MRQRKGFSSLHPDVSFRVRRGLGLGQQGPSPCDRMPRHQKSCAYGRRLTAGALPLCSRCIMAALPSPRALAANTPARVELLSAGIRLRGTSLFLDATQTTGLSFVSHAHFESRGAPSARAGERGHAQDPLAPPGQAAIRAAHTFRQPLPWKASTSSCSPRPCLGLFTIRMLHKGRWSPTRRSQHCA